MLGLVRSLPEGHGDVLTALKAEASKLDSRLLRQREADNEALWRLRHTLDGNLTFLKASLEKELSSLRTNSGGVPTLRSPRVRSANANNETDVVLDAGTISPIGLSDFWKAKQEDAYTELKRLQHHLTSVRSKFRDIQRIGETSSDNRTSGSLLCEFGSLRSRLQATRTQAKHYHKLLADLDADISELPQTRGHSPAETTTNEDYESETSSLCYIESGILNQIETVRACVELAQKRKSALELRTTYFQELMETGSFDSFSPPTIEEEESRLIEVTDPLSDAQCRAAVEQEQNLNSELSSLLRERRVQMLRELDDATLSRWVEQERLSALSEKVERAIAVAEREKLTLLQKLDGISTEAKVHSAIIRNKMYHS